MVDKMEKIAPIPSVPFSSKSNRYKLRSVGFNIIFYCHDDVFVAIPSRFVATVAQKKSFFAAVVTAKNYIKIHISNLVGDMNLPIGILLDPNWRYILYHFQFFKKIQYGRNTLGKCFYHMISSKYKVITNIKSKIKTIKHF